MAKLLTKANHCMSSSIQHEHQQQQQHQHQQQQQQSSKNKLLSLSKKKQYTNVPITSCHNHHNRSDSFHVNSKNNKINSKKRENHNMCLACSKSRLTQSPSSSLNNSLHSLSSSTSTSSTPMKNGDLDEVISRSTSATSTTSTISTCSSAASSPSSTRTISDPPLYAGVKSSFSTQHDDVINMDLSTKTRRGILLTSRSTKKKKRVHFASPSTGGASEAASSQDECGYADDQDLPPLPSDASPVSQTNPQQQSLDLDANTQSSSSNSYPIHTTVIEYIQPSSTMTEAQHNDAYWQLKDYEYFRGTAQIIANEVLKVTATQAPTAHSYNTVMTRVYDLCAVLSEREHLEQQQQQQLREEEQRSKQRSDVDNAELEKSNSKVGVEIDDGIVATIPSSFSSLSSNSSNPPPPSPSSLSSSSCNSKMMIPPHLFAALTHWIKAGHSRRGLEKFCVTSHVRTRPMAKVATVQAVLLAQDLLRQLKEEQQTEEENNKQSQPTKFHIGANEFSLENSSQEEVLRAVSERFSKTSRYYGTAIGHADAAAVGNYDHPLKN